MEAVYLMQETIGQFLRSQFQHLKLRHLTLTEFENNSVGDYESLFGQKSPEEIEAGETSGSCCSYLEQGNLYFWTTLSILIVAAVIQGEFYERRFGGGPPHLT